jgi:predicted NACHT family NTPase
LPRDARDWVVGLGFRDRRALRTRLLEGAEDDWKRFEQEILTSSPRIPLSAVRGGRARSVPVPADDPLTLFDDARGRLALAGRPGSGKTTTAVVLFSELLTRAREDPGADVPVYVRLSAWRGNRTLEAWLSEELQAARGLGSREAREALRTAVLVLDGLDEVAELHRYGCAREIARYAPG